MYPWGFAVPRSVEIAVVERVKEENGRGKVRGTSGMSGDQTWRVWRDGE